MILIKFSLNFLIYSNNNKMTLFYIKNKLEFSVLLPRFILSLISDTPRHFYFLHTLTWMMNMFGVFFILAAHEHYSIDVFVAFYISSRLFLYYHTLSNNQALMQRDSNRTRVWFPLFSYFEASVDGIVPNEYDSLYEIFTNVKEFLTAKFSEVRSYHMQITQNNNISEKQSSLATNSISDDNKIKTC